MNAAAPNISRQAGWSLGFGELPIFRGLFLLWVNAALLIVCLAAFTSGVVASGFMLVDTVNIGLLEALLLPIPFVWSSRRGWDVRLPHVFSLFLHGLIGVYWFVVVSGGSYPFVLLTLYVVILLFRYHGLYQTDSITDANRLAFGLDSIGMFLIAMYYYWWSLPIGGAIQESIKPYFVPSLFLVVVLRLFLLWSIERIQTHARHVSARNLWILALLVMLLVLFERHILITVLLGVFGGVGMVTVPFLSQVIPHVDFTPVSKIRFRNQNPNLQSLGSISNVSIQYVLIAHVVLYILLAIALVSLLYLFFRKKKTGSHTAPQSLPQTAKIIRRSISSSPEEIFLRTENSVRLRAQKWMHGQFRRGRIKPTQTWRAMTQDDQSADMKALRSEYESERYR